MTIFKIGDHVDIIYEPRYGTPVFSKGGIVTEVSIGHRYIRVMWLANKVENWVYPTELILRNVEPFEGELEFEC